MVKLIISGRGIRALEFEKLLLLRSCQICKERGRPQMVFILYLPDQEACKVPGVNTRCGTVFKASGDSLARQPGSCKMLHFVTKDEKGYCVGSIPEPQTCRIYLCRR